MHDSRERRTAPAAGFSVVEIIVVVAIIAILAATAIPITMAYLRTYAINGAASMVASEIQSARAQAIKRNVNWGIVFVTVSDTQFQFVSEDIPPGPDCPGPPCAFTRVPIDVGVGVTLPGRGPGPVRVLPAGVIFDTPNTGPDRGFRFNRFGAMCDPGSAINCPDLPGGFPTGPPYVAIDPLAGATIQLLQPSTGLTRTVSVAPGGRVTTQ
jgi:prepilin-type N-terminal cleavage/methylation domain-containing protein